MTFHPKRDFFIGIDSDGCAFDTMEAKHKQVFIPQAIESLGFESIADQYRRVAERVNLYSRTRGSNRFIGITLCLEELRRDPELRAWIPDPAPIRTYTHSGLPLSNDSFAEYVGDDPPELLRRVLHWSATSNQRIAAMQREPRVFPGVHETIEAARRFANTMIVSATPASALRGEWAQAGLLDKMDVVAGQEVGPKRDQLAAAAADFDRERSVMVGDAPGDYEAARANGILFFPITPGDESSSWAELRSTGLERLKSGSFRGDYQDRLVETYFRVLDAATTGVSRHES